MNTQRASVKRCLDRFLPSSPRPTLSSSRLSLYNSSNPPTEMAEMVLLIRGQDPCGPARALMAPAYVCESAGGKRVMTMMKQKAPEKKRERITSEHEGAIYRRRKRGVEVGTGGVISRNNEEGKEK